MMQSREIDNVNAIVAALVVRLADDFPPVVELREKSAYLLKGASDTQVIDIPCNVRRDAQGLAL